MCLAARVFRYPAGGGRLGGWAGHLAVLPVKYIGSIGYLPTVDKVGSPEPLGSPASKSGPTGPGTGPTGAALDAFPGVNGPPGAADWPPASRDQRPRIQDEYCEVVQGPGPWRASPEEVRRHCRPTFRPHHPSILRCLLPLFSGSWSWSWSWSLRSFLPGSKMFCDEVSWSLGRSARIDSRQLGALSCASLPRGQPCHASRPRTRQPPFGKYRPQHAPTLPYLPAERGTNHATRHACGRALASKKAGRQPAR